MVNVTLWWLLVVPLLLSGATYFILARFAGSQQLSWQDHAKMAGLCLGGLIISAGIISAAFYAGKGSRTADTQVLNGEVTGKNRVHDSYVRTYQCRCREICTGTGSSRSCTTTCDTCYEDRYTVTWNVFSNVGTFRINHLDSTSRSVYRSPDPPFYTQASKGDPVAALSSYTNYIKAVPESLFRPVSKDLKQRFADLIPAYPLNSYGFYSLDRVLTPGITVPDLKVWNHRLAHALKTLGPTKQANVVIVIAKTADPSYFYALQDAWINGKKNDVVVVIGAPEFPKPAWVNVMALTDKKLMQVKLRDDIMALETLTAEAVIGAINHNVLSYHQRKSMKDFEYLNAQIDPPTWVIVLTLVLIVAAYVGFWIFYYKAGPRHWQLQRRRQFSNHRR